jgi:predicted O-methyltransferase YrrM
MARMRVGILPENVVERVALRSGLVPVPLAESWFTFLLARAIMTATKAGVFEALAAGRLTADEVAARCGTHPGATGKLLNALVGCRYVTFASGRYAISPHARRWLLADSPQSCRDKVLLQFIEWDICAGGEAYLKTGAPVDFHQRLSEEAWGVYQRGMRSGIEPMAREVVRRLSLPRDPRRMLDIGGSHGFWSVSFCRRYPRLSSTILDLPEAIRHAAPILAKEGMGDRVVHRAGDALTADLGGDHDLIFLGSLVHHLDEATNAALMKRVAGALKPGGVVAIYEAFRVEASDRIGQIGGLMDLFFAMTSAAGTYSPDEMAAWQRAAGLRPRRPMRLWLVGDVGVQAAVKPRR